MIKPIIMTLVCMYISPKIYPIVWINFGINGKVMSSKLGDWPLHAYSTKQSITHACTLCCSMMSVNQSIEVYSCDGEYEIGMKISSVWFWNGWVLVTKRIIECWQPNEFSHKHSTLIFLITANYIPKWNLIYSQGPNWKWNADNQIELQNNIETLRPHQKQQADSHWIWQPTKIFGCHCTMAGEFWHKLSSIIRGRNSNDDPI